MPIVAALPGVLARLALKLPPALPGISSLLTNRLSCVNDSFSSELSALPWLKSFVVLLNHGFCIVEDRYFSLTCTLMWSSFCILSSSRMYASLSFLLFYML